MLIDNLRENKNKVIELNERSEDTGELLRTFEINYFMQEIRTVLKQIHERECNEGHRNYCVRYLLKKLKAFEEFLEAIGEEIEFTINMEAPHLTSENELEKLIRVVRKEREKA